MAGIETLLYLASAAGAYGQYESGQEQKRQAKAQAVEREFEADQLDQIASNEKGAGQRRAAGERRKARIIESRALAVAAKDGGASDPTVVDIISDIAAEGAYNAAIAMYEADERAANARMAAAARRFEGGNSLIAGRAAARAGAIRGTAGFFSDAGQIYGKYGRRETPKPNDTPGLYPYNP